MTIVEKKLVLRHEKKIKRRVLSFLAETMGLAAAAVVERREARAAEAAAKLQRDQASLARSPTELWSEREKQKKQAAAGAAMKSIGMRLTTGVSAQVRIQRAASAASAAF